jgi:hypothetical protein
MFFGPIKDELGSTLLNPEELVNVFMHLVADLFLRLQAHHHKLQVLAGEQHSPKVLVLFGCLFDRSHIAGHFLCLLGY